LKPVRNQLFYSSYQNQKVVHKTHIKSVLIKNGLKITSKPIRIAMKLQRKDST
jgi:hypothetical protein